MKNDNPRNLIRLSISKGGVRNTALKNKSGSFKSLFSRLSKPSVSDKDGSYFVRGPVNETAKRANANITVANLVILDGDSRITETGEILEGAPPAKQVHQVLRELDIQHILYTSHSHGAKGERYRALIIPDRPLANPKELKGCVDWVIHKLHAAGVLLNSVSENYSWAQPWFFPRIRSNDALFECFAHKDGKPLSVDHCQSWAIPITACDKQAIVTSICPSSRSTAVSAPDSPIGKYNAEHGNAEAMLKMLLAHGYALKGQTRINKEIAFRLLAPQSSSNRPGVILFKHAAGIWRVCSHHNKESDPLAKRGDDEKYLAHDAFDVNRILEHNGDFAKALAAITPKKMVIEVAGGTLANNVHQVIKLLGHTDPPTIFQRGPLLVRVAHLPQTVEIEGCTIPAGSAVIVTLTSTDLTVRLCDMASWMRAAKKGELVTWQPIDPPAQVAKGILAAQGDWSGIPSLKAVAEAPILRRDGSIRDTVGYDPTTGLYYEGGCPPLTIPEKPTRADARRAAKQLIKVFREFPFVNSEIARSVVLAYIFTLIMRGQLTLAPLFAVSATTAGTGKGLLIEICNLIARGRDAAIMPPVSGGGAEEETRKRITALLLQGANAVNLDNWVTPIGGESLNGLLTANEWSDRILGRSEAVKLPNRVTWAATGNNLTVRGDMVRRSMLIQLDAQVERPELRNFRLPNLAQYVLKHRGELLSAVFTILRAYQLAGCPEEDGLVLGRFEGWSRTVCAPIRWIGRPDPIESQERLRHNDPESAKLERLLDAWFAVHEDQAVSVAELVRTTSENMVSNSQAQNDLHEALMECAGDRGHINTRSLGWFLKRFAGRIVASLQLLRMELDRCKTPKYYVQRVGPSSNG